MLHLWSLSVPTFRDDLRILYILRENLRALLDKRGETQTALAKACGHEKAWISKFLADRNYIDGREVSLVDLDKIAEFLGVSTFQLFQPGVSRTTERRTGTDRRTFVERRIGSAGRQAEALRLEINKVPALASGLRPAALAFAQMVDGWPPDARAELFRQGAGIDKIVRAKGGTQSTARNPPAPAEKARRKRGAQRGDDA